MHVLLLAFISYMLIIIISKTPAQLRKVVCNSQIMITEFLCHFKGRSHRMQIQFSETSAALENVQKVNYCTEINTF